MTDAELNATVALLLGWPNKSTFSPTFGAGRWGRWWGGLRENPLPWIYDKYGYRSFRPATDIRDAWIVVEWLREQGCDVEVLAGGSGANNVLVQSDHRGWFGPLSTESPMPRAICEAALAWAEARKKARNV